MAVEQVRGRIKSGEHTLIEVTDLSINPASDRDGKSWDGHFIAPKLCGIDVGGPYRLELVDGRSGDIVVKRMAVGSHKETVAMFESHGPLA